ncbi:MAG TPA: 2-phosphosulfolactate phosphatase [Longimicrobiales bacterium]|nr:2-phosphosulfolactate phosphatase [Longimicrobiales bacterium]
MRLDVYFTPGELSGVELPDRVVVIDVLRATSTLVEALANGAKAVFPVATADDAARIALSIGRDSVLLCGERKGLPIEGFDLGNSPLEFTRETVADLSLVMTTTNGTRTFLAVAERRGGKADGEAGLILAASFLNLGAVVDRLAGADGPTAVVCAGREGRFALEDAVCAGALVRRLAEGGGALERNDAAAAAAALAQRHLPKLPALLAGTAAGSHLRSIGLEDDVTFCGTVDRTAVVPRFRERKITLE